MAEGSALAVFQHTPISVYLVAVFAIACIFYDSTQVPRTPVSCCKVLGPQEQSRQFNSPDLLHLPCK